MAHPDHVQRLEDGPSRWRRWRLDEPWVQVDLNRADLRGKDLDLFDLHGVHMSDVELDSASLRDTNLKGASFTSCRLVETNLQGAYMENVTMSYCLATGADLRYAEIYRSRFHAVSLGEADMSRGEITGVAFNSCDLSDIRGIDQAAIGPCSIGFDSLAITLMRSGEVFSPGTRRFLESAGVPESLLTYLPSLLEAAPIQFMSCFVSYGGTDKPFASQLYDDLRERGVRCWLYDEDAIIGRGVWANIDRAISAHEKTIVICSSSSLQRPGVQREIERALQREDDLRRERAIRNIDIDTDVLIPIRLDDDVLTGWRHERKADVVAKHIGDFSNWQDPEGYEAAFARLLRALDPSSRLGLT